jgi:hypothetical protein
MKKALGLIGAALLMAAPAIAEEVPQVAPPAQFNCDYQPSCEVAPGIYGKMSSPVASKFKLSIGGYVKLDYAYNSDYLGASGVISPGTGAIPSKGIGLNNGANAANQEQSILSVRQSRLWFKVDGPTLLGAKTGSLIETDFYGDNSAPTESPQMRLRLAYGTMDWANTQVLFGQAYDMFAPMIASTQDFRSGSPYGSPNSPRIPQIRLTEKLNFTKDNQLKFVLAVQDPDQTGNNQAAATGGTGPNLLYAGQISFVSKNLGAAPGYFGMSMNPLTLTAFGEYGNERAASNNNKQIDTWGYGLYAFVPVLKSSNGMDRTMTMSIEAQAYMAANMAFNGATWTSVTGTPNAISNTVNTAGIQTPAQDWGATAQVIFYPTQSLGITAGWGSRYAYNKVNYDIANYERQSQEAYANVAYDLNAAVRVAAEYQNMQTVYGNANGSAALLLTGRKAVGTDNTYRLCAYYFF